ncbi:bifunctional aldolase/short-chain dehydrogenase [Georgenia sp. H159]|uniref:bifunctional aldolase/short-chain dehydrogenase n=1 Tax=Georgenia sp. H159 TaxID=3076115 RepID=UPI002D7A23E1|nr:bifunctional aldolase/short-chain dehydrogenase [Georgenia sp. H159]
MGTTVVPDAVLDALDELVAGSRELGVDAGLVLHGGGNTSLKVAWPDVTGRSVPVLLMKGSGHDLATIDRSGFTPLRLDRLRELLPPTRLTDRQMRNELRCARLDAEGPDPSVETFVHALLPHDAVFHSHADVLLALTNTDDGERIVRELYGDLVVVVPYAMPGPDLAAACARAWDEESHAGTRGLVVLRHGLFTVGDSSGEALARHHELVALAEERVAAAGAARLDDPRGAAGTTAPSSATELARLRAELSRVAGFPMVVRHHDDAQVRRFLTDGGLRAATQQGPLTPDHVLWTKRVPLVGTDVDGYAAEYGEYVARNEHRRGEPITLLDPAPRVVLDDALGMLTAGRTASEARAAADVYRHTMTTIEQAERLGGYRAPDEGHIFDLEYWSLQQEKLRRAGPRPPLEGRVAVVTGAASGIGRACAAELLAAGAAVVGWDLSPDVASTFTGPDWLGLTVDVTDEHQVTAALQRTVEELGGLDVLVVAAGIFPRSQPLAELEAETWRRTMGVNVDSAALLFSRAHPLLACAPDGGRVVVVASKNVAAPGKGAAAYSASKAALTQLARVAALEWAEDGIRVNLVHPDAVFDTGLWTAELLATRAAHYGLSVEEYKRRNLLGTEVTSTAVGRLVRAMADQTFACTTGAQVPVDGGNERVI